MTALHSHTLNQTWNLAEGVTNLGSDSSNDICLNHPSVDDFHAVLIYKNNRINIRSLETNHGIQINEQLTDAATLTPGTTFRLGQIDLTLLAGSPPTTSASDDVEIIVPAVAVHTDRPTLEDGTLACRKHPHVAATVYCTACERTYCSDCVRPVGLQGRQKRLFCPHCSQPCTPLYAQQTTSRNLPPLKRALRWFQRLLRS
jgi:hypothetical protein